MKFTVEVEEFWVEEAELSSALIGVVTKDVTNQIKKSIEKQVDLAIKTIVQARIEQELALQINMRVSELIAAGVIVRDGEEILIADHIKNLFQKNSGWNSPVDLLSKMAKQYGDEMKKRYDYLYANQIVQQLHTIGVIKEDIYKNLIEPGS
jgi:uncharacterized C2H2 Zn-finger protein